MRINTYKVLAINMLFMYVCMYDYLCTIIYLLCTYCVNVAMHVIVYITDMRINTYFIICLII